MHSLGSICDFYSPVFANILFMLLRLRQMFSFITADISHERNTGHEPNHCYLHMKYEKFHNLNVRKAFGRVMRARAQCACRCNLHRVRHKWNVVAGGSRSELFNQYPCRQRGWGPLAPVGQVKWLWCEMTGAFTEAVLPFPSLSFTHSLSHTHTHTHTTATLHCSYPH